MKTFKMNVSNPEKFETGDEITIKSYYDNNIKGKGFHYLIYGITKHQLILLKFSLINKLFLKIIRKYRVICLSFFYQIFKLMKGRENE